MERRQYFINCIYWCDVNEFDATGDAMSMTNRQVIIITADASVWSTVWLHFSRLNWRLNKDDWYLCKKFVLKNNTRAFLLWEYDMDTNWTILRVTVLSGVSIILIITAFRNVSPVGLVVLACILDFILQKKHFDQKFWSFWSWAHTTYTFYSASMKTCPNTYRV